LTAVAGVSDGKLWKKLPAADVIYYFKVTNTRFDEKTIDYYDEECQDEDYDETKEKQAHEYLIDQIHKLTGEKPRISPYNDGYAIYDK